MSGSLAGALDLTGSCHLGKQDGGSERADSFNGAEPVDDRGRVAGENGSAE